LEPRIHPDAIVEYRDALPIALCEAIIARFDAEPQVRAGTTLKTDGFGEVLDASIKRCREYRIGPDSPQPWIELDRGLVEAKRRVLTHYFEIYPWAAQLNMISSGFQVQRYDPGDEFDWHIDHDGQRHIAFIAYLNEGFEGGQTEFMRQGLSYLPRAGSILLFPPFWTHPHRGAPIEAGHKYIVTSFMLVREASGPPPS
jgi:hypothetical protein